MPETDYQQRVAMLVPRGRDIHSAIEGSCSRDARSAAGLFAGGEARNLSYFTVNGAMMSPPNVNCEPLVPAAKGVVPFKDAS